MQKNEWLNWNVRTDLAYDEAIKYHGSELEGLITEEKESYGIKVIKNIINQSGEEKLKKRSGVYYTLDLMGVNFHDTSTCENVEKALAETLLELLTSMGLQNKRCLLVGLGNINVTPDALGPYVMDNVIVTRHLFKLGSVSEGFSEVSAISPGVMGTTGIETFDIIKSVVDSIDVDFVVVVDALASSSISRLNKTIQITDTGISPGSGVGNKRKELSNNTVGKPVIAVGVPTVVDAVTITSDTIEYVLRYLNEDVNGKVPLANKLAPGNSLMNLENANSGSEKVREHFFGQIGLLNEVEKRSLMQDILTSNGYNMMVTPKEIDADVEDLAKIIATGIDLALHNGLLNYQTE